MKHCSCDNEISHDGSGQLGRYLKALDPSYAPVDGRSTADLLVFARKYAAQIRFYDLPGSIIDDGIPAKKVSWREFFRRDIAVVAASIAVTNAESFKKEYDQVNEQLKDNATADVYGAIYAPIAGMMKKIDWWYTVAIPGNPLHNDLTLAIGSDLKAQAQKVIAYAKGYKYVEPNVDLQIDLEKIENRDVWGLDESIPPDASIYVGTNQHEKILNASLYSEDVFYAFYNFLNALIEKSTSYIENAMFSYPAHKPHMALFISFLQLFRAAQDQMNGLTARMLDFYYKEVLHLETKPSVPDKAHIVFELAQDVLEYNLSADTSLTAGDDNTGVEQIYKTVDDLVINQAKIKELKTIFVEKNENELNAGNPFIHKVYARPVANSADGFGEKFTAPDNKWPTFGKGSPSGKKPKNICQKIEIVKEEFKPRDEVRIGFGIASPQLLLQGGKRLIQIKLNESAVVLFDRQLKMRKEGLGNLFEFWFSGQEEWFKVDQMMSESDEMHFTRFLSIGIFNPFADKIDASYYINRGTFSIYVYLPDSSSPVIQYDPEIHKTFPYPSSQPIMQMLLNGDIDLLSDEYKKLSVKGISLGVKVGSIFPPNASNRDMVELFNEHAVTITKEESVELQKMEADGLNQIVIQTATNEIISPGTPFDPFSPYPNFNKSFFLGSEEIFNKPLGQLSVFISKTLDNLKSGAGRKTGEYDVSILEKSRWIRLSTFEATSFDTRTIKSNILHKIARKDEVGEQKTVPHIHTRLPFKNVKEWIPGIDKGFIRVTNLIPVSNNDDDDVGFMERSQNMAPRFEIKEVSLNYESVLDRLEAGIDKFYHVYPFGVVPTYLEYESIVDNPILRIAEANASIFKSRTIRLKNDPFELVDREQDFILVRAHNIMLPQLTYVWPYAQFSSLKGKRSEKEILKARNRSEEDIEIEKLILSASGGKLIDGDNQYSGIDQEEGSLLIGLENARPLQTVSMLFQFAEGTASDEDNDPPEIHWSYLTNNEWRPLKDESIISDGTYGFQTTGIIKIEIPDEATNNNSVVTPGLHWLCASVTQYSNRIPMLVNIVTQAVVAEFNDNQNDPSHFDNALAAGSISKLSVTAAEVSKVEQPFSSYNGKPREVGKEFYTRSSERLRHKARAITPWDYEHMVLNQFPSVYKVKCITRTDPECLCREPEKRAVPIEENCCGPQIAPGHVLLVPVSNLKNRNAVNPLQPKTARRVLLEIEEYLKKRTSPFVRVHAKNPVYEQVLVFFRVKFWEGKDKGFYTKKLNDDIVRFLTPWAFDDGHEVVFGQKIYASSIINFIEEREYVDFITDFLMIICRAGCCEDIMEEPVPQVPIDELLDKIAGCCDMELLFADEARFQGDIIATPSTPRSLLVSAPKHIIVPYREEETITFCEKLKIIKAGGQTEHSILNIPPGTLSESTGDITSHINKPLPIEQPVRTSGSKAILEPVASKVVLKPKTTKVINPPEKKALEKPTTKAKKTIRKK